MKKIYLFLLLCTAQRALAQYGVQSPAGNGMGNATVAQQGIGSLFSNPAGLAYLEDLGAMAFAERRFLLSELQTVSAGLGLPTKSGSFGLVVQRFGFEGFRQQKAGLSYARRMGKGFSVGAQFDYFQVRIPDYGSRNSFTFEIGCQALIAKSLTIGAYAFSPAKVQLAEGDNLPTYFRLGLGYRISEKTLLMVELEKELESAYRLKGGFEYRAMEAVAIRAGFQSDPTIFHFGLGFDLGGKLSADMASSFHQTLGLTPSAGLRFSK